MPRLINSFVNYSRERLIKITWFVLPLSLFIIGHGPDDFNFLLCLNLFLAIFFFRVTDDYFCFDYDKKQKDRKYLSRDKKDVLFLALVYGVFYLVTLKMFYQQKEVLFIYSQLIISTFLYIILRENKSVVLVSILKYPILLYILATQTGETNYVWVMSLTLFFIVREYSEEFLNKRNVKIELFIISLIIGMKLYMRYL